MPRLTPTLWTLRRGLQRAVQFWLDLQRDEIARWEGETGQTTEETPSEEHTSCGAKEHAPSISDLVAERQQDQRRSN